MQETLTQERLKELLEYNSESGVFLWRSFRGGLAKAGTVAGRPNACGHLQIMVDGRRYQAHRLAFLYVFGRFPRAQIDHINRVRNDNRISNLREATNSENQQNRARQYNNKSGSSDVVWTEKLQKWRVRIAINGKRHHIGYFSDLVSAKQAREFAKQKFHTFHPIEC